MVEHDVRLDLAQVGQRIVLPTSFRNSPRLMMQAYQDAMAIVRSKGIPNVFLTFTYNPNWQELDGLPKLLGIFGQGILKTRPTSHPSALYFSSRTKSFHNQRHRSLSVDGASSSKKCTFF
jgi:hypothetical protein